MLIFKKGTGRKVFHEPHHNVHAFRAIRIPYNILLCEQRITQDDKQMSIEEDIESKVIPENYEESLLESLRDNLDSDIDKLNAAKNKNSRFSALPRAVRAHAILGDLGTAKSLSEELLNLSEEYTDNWNFGNAIHDGNIVLGIVALSEGKIEKAKEYLLIAGDTPGSPQLDSFGPNMRLAREMLKKGENQTVLIYFDKCRKFWKLGKTWLDIWERKVKENEIPNFSMHLIN